jgi:hypothetical protein
MRESHPLSSSLNQFIYLYEISKRVPEFLPIRFFNFKNVSNDSRIT